MPEAVAQGESRGRSRCEVADDAVVVRKFRPEMPGNSVEDKTGTTAGGGSADRSGPKALIGCEGRKSLTRVTDDERTGGRCVHKLPDGAGTCIGVLRERSGSGVLRTRE